jgi:hypothetical protein
MDVYGRDNVRGGKYTKINLTDKKEILPEENDPLTELDQIMEFSKNEWVQNILKAKYKSIDMNTIIKSNGQWYCEVPGAHAQSRNLVFIEMYTGPYGNSEIRTHGACRAIQDSPNLSILNLIWKLHNEDHKYIQTQQPPDLHNILPFYNYYKAIE